MAAVYRPCNTTQTQPEIQQQPLIARSSRLVTHRRVRSTVGPASTDDSGDLAPAGWGLTRGGYHAEGTPQPHHKYDHQTENNEHNGADGEQATLSSSVVHTTHNRLQQHFQ